MHTSKLYLRIPYNSKYFSKRKGCRRYVDYELYDLADSNLINVVRMPTGTWDKFFSIFTYKIEGSPSDILKVIDKLIEDGADFEIKAKYN
jgi:hypothetical protein